MFCGGLNVGINIEAKRIIANDINLPLIQVYKLMQQTGADKLHNDILNVINKYELSKTNQQGFLLLREEYNRTHDPLLLLVLIFYGFNNQLRFNRKGQFNISFGKNRSSYNPRLQKKLKAFVDRLHVSPITLTNLDFREFNFSALGGGGLTVVYCDPPYSLADATYNNFWRQQEDLALFETLDKLNSAGVVFFMSNVLEHKGVINTPLSNWASKYRVIDLNYDYSNCSYHRKDSSGSREVLITNYKEIT